MMKKLLVLLLLIPFANSKATTRDVPGSYPTIQSALNACITGDTVLVIQGIYNENIIWPVVNGIKLLSAGTSNTTIIYANNSGKVISINSAFIDTNTVIRGFTITGGYINTGSSGYGAGIYLNNASVVMDDLVIDGNRVFVPGGHGHGAGVHMNNSSSVIRNCYINNNSIDSATWCYGGGMYINGGSPTITDTEISGNTLRAENWCYGVGVYATNSNIEFNRVKITDNFSGDDAIWYYGSGIYVDETTANLTNVLIALNRSGLGGSFNYGGGIYCDGSSTIVTMYNVTIAQNRKTNNGTINGSGLYARDAWVVVYNSILYNQNTGSEVNTGGTANLDIEYSNVRGGYSGVGNVNFATGFVSAIDFHLMPTSPCAGLAIAAVAPAIDLDGVARPLPAATMPDMGCFEVDQSVTGISEIETIAIRVYPNPVVEGNIITIENIRDYFEITDFTGRVIYRSEVNDTSMKINTSGWNAGVYFIQSAVGESRKFVVIK